MIAQVFLSAARQGAAHVMQITRRWP